MKKILFILISVVIVVSMSMCVFATEYPNQFDMDEFLGVQSVILIDLDENIIGRHLLDLDGNQIYQYDMSEVDKEIKIHPYLYTVNLVPNGFLLFDDFIKSQNNEI